MVRINYFYSMEIDPNMAKLITTELNWEDLVLPESTMSDIDEILNWVKTENKLRDNAHLRKWLKPGFRTLFSGPSGTGKTMVATLLGKAVNRPVYRINLSTVASKYIGETEKNLAKVFDHAENNNWILFFDEADALFGKRTNVKDSHDKYANQEVSYLLQRIEDFPGLVILSSNFKNNIDDAFMRRFQSIVAFQTPNRRERLKLWQRIFSDKYKLDEGFVTKLSEDYELTGGAITNVLRTVVLQSETSNEDVLSKKAVMHAIKREMKKRMF